MQRRRRQLVVGAVSALAAPALFFGKSYAATPRAVLRTAWWSDPFARGSYSHLGLHGTRADRAQMRASGAGERQDRCKGAVHSFRLIKNGHHCEKTGLDGHGASPFGMNRYGPSLGRAERISL